MSSKKLIINRDRFSHIEDIGEIKTKDESRFESKAQEGEEGIELVDIKKLIPAPKNWNFYRKLPEDKFFELLESIKENYLLNPIIIWEQEEDYMILSGHNRVDAFKKLYEITQDEKYLKIPSIIKSRTQINQESAKEIIVDTNWVQRQLTVYEKTKSILSKYTKEKNTSEKGKTRDKVAKLYGISGRMVQNYLSLNNLIEDAFEKLEDGTITIKEGVEISKKEPITQKNIINIMTEEKISLNILKKIHPDSDTQDIRDIIDENREDISITVKIPKDKEEDFYQFFEKWKKTL